MPRLTKQQEAKITQTIIPLVKQWFKKDCTVEDILTDGPMEVVRFLWYCDPSNPNHRQIKHMVEDVESLDGLLYSTTEFNQNKIPWRALTDANQKAVAKRALVRLVG